MSKGKIGRPLTLTEYEALAEFRYQLRMFLRRMEDEVRSVGINPQQYQLVLAIHGLPAGKAPSIRTLAERMQLNHNSMVELVDRCEEGGLLRRTRSAEDRRQVVLAITPQGSSLLRRLGSAAREELRESGPHLVQAVVRLTGAGETRPRSKRKKKAGS